MKRPPAPAPETAGPRNDFGPRPDFGPREALDIAAALQARQRARLARLTPAGRLRKWGGV